MLGHWLLGKANREGRGKYLSKTKTGESIYCPLNADKLALIDLFNLRDAEIRYNSIRNAYIKTATALPVEYDVSTLSFYNRQE